MKLGKIVGTVVATQKNEALIGATLLVVQDLKLDLAPASGSLVCVDSLGAGIGDVVLYVSGSSARLTEVSKDRPVDATVIAIVDTVEVEGQVVFSKGAS